MNHEAVERFHAQVYPEPNSGCWLWDGTLSPNGYGRITVRKKVCYAHRVSYAMHMGPIPDGMLVCHKCDVRACVNPAHLFLGTALDNSMDMMTKGRWRQPQHNDPARGDRHGSRTHPERVPRGENHVHAKLTEPGVHEIRAMSSRGETQAAIAKAMGVSCAAVRRVLKGKSWRHV